jgi:hypothetical protein
MLVAVCKTQTADKQHEWADIAVTTCGMHSRGIVVRFPEVSGPILGTPLWAVQCVKKVIFSGVKKPESGTKNLPIPSAELKNK